MRTRLQGLALIAFGLAGCASQGGRDPFAAVNPFRTEPRFDPKSAPPANTQAATRADAVASAIIAQSRAELPDKPVLMTIGRKEPMIFHQRSGMVVVSDGLVERCRTDEELAAVLCYELGKLAAEQAEKTAPRDTDVPPAPRLSQDVVGGGYSADMTRLAEEAKYARRNPSAGRNAREARPDARTLGQNMYTRAGHNADDFARMESLVKEAEENAENRDIMRGR